MTLKAKMIIAVILVIAVLLCGTAWLHFLFYRQEMIKSISRDQFTLVSAMTEEIDQKIFSAQGYLQSLADTITPELVADETALENFFRSVRNQRHFFDEGITLFAPDGTLMTGTDTSISHFKADCFHLDHYRLETLETGLPQISEPFSPTIADEPFVIFTVPVTGATQEVIAVLIGQLNLLNNNFLGHLAEVRLGQGGYLYLYNQSRTLIVHPNRSRIMKRDVPIGSNLMFDKALTGLEGTGETITSFGLHTLSSFKRLQSTNWILAANFPVTEAFASITTAKKQFFSGLIISLVMAALLVRRLMQHLLTPLDQLTRQIQHYDGTHLPPQIEVQTSDEIGKLAGAFNQMLHQLKKQESALKEQLHFLQVLIDAIPQPVFYKNKEGRFLGCNRAFETSLGITRRDLINKTAHDIAPKELADRYELADRELFASGLGATQIYEHSLVYADNIPRDVIFFRAAFPDSKGNLGGMVGTVLDISERKQYERQLEKLATRDELTGLANRTLLFDRIEQAIRSARRSAGRFAVLLLNIDRFKIINDSLGHDYGDKLLCEVAARLRQTMRETDTVSRFGGDEFVVLLKDIETPEDIRQIATKILNIFTVAFELDQREFSLTASLGISIYPDDGGDKTILVRNANIAMYHSKKLKNHFSCYSEEMNHQLLETLELENALRHALNKDQFTLYYQPKIDLKSSSINGCEALIRWQHPEHGLVSPATFIPLAEETGLIVEIGEWVLKEACRQGLAWQQSGLTPVPVAVNLSARQFHRSDLVTRVAAILEESGFPAELLELELTESMIMDDPVETEKILHGLKSLGVKLSLDDFGTGYSSLNYLRRFPVDCLKIDRSFIQDVPTDPSGASVVSSIIDIAHNLRITAVAEGVETDEQLEFLNRCSCDSMQGYLFSKPLPADDFFTLAQNQKKRSLPGDATEKNG